MKTEPMHMTSEFELDLHQLRKSITYRCVGVLVPFENARTGPIRTDGSELLIGRDSGGAGDLKDRSVSREHARIVSSGETFVVEDLGSVNGTFVAGTAVMSCPLHDGDVVRFGRCEYVFERAFELLTGEGVAGHE